MSTVLRKRTSRRGMCALAIASLCLLTGAGAAYAYLTDNDNAINALSINDVDITIEEEFTPPQSHSPNSSYQKIVRVKNTGKGSAYVRALVAYSNNVAEENTRISFNTDGWEGPDADGFWYYRSVVLEGELTDPLFNQVDVISTPKDGWSDYDIFVYAEATQTIDGRSSATFATAKDAFDAMRESAL